MREFWFERPIEHQHWTIVTIEPMYTLITLPSFDQVYIGFQWLL